jgi:hypothetical protein
LASERYFNSTGSVTTGLRAVYDAINKAIMNQNRIELRQYEVNFICGVLHDSSLFLSRCGLALGIVYYQSNSACSQPIRWMIPRWSLAHRSAW